MFKKRFLILMCMWGLLLCFCCGMVFGFGRNGRPYEVTSITMPENPAPGHLILQFQALPDHKCEKVYMKIRKIEGLDYSGQMEFEEHYVDSQPAIFEIPFNLPNNDTCGFEVEFTTNILSYPYKRKRYWTTTDDTTISFETDPRNTLEAKAARRKQGVDSTFVKRDQWAKEHPHGISIGTFTDKDGNEISEEEYYRRQAEKKHLTDSIHQYNSRIVLGDTTVTYVRSDSGWIPIKNTEIRAYHRRLKMRSLEKMPLESDDVQVFYVTEDEVYVRNRGESTFTNLDSIGVGWQADRAKADSVRATHSNRPRRYILNLADPDKYALAEAIVDSLMATDSAGYYRVILTSEQFISLAENGIKPVGKWKDEKNTD